MKPEPEIGTRRTGDPVQRGHGSHSWVMMLCCIPMLVIAVLLVATGVVSATFLLAAIMCTLMMAMMMRVMGSGTRESHH